MTATRELTLRQEQILGFMRRYLAVNGYSPTVRTIETEFGLSSPNGVMAHLAALVRKGALRRVRVGSKSRYLPVVPEGCCPCCARPLDG